MYQTVNKQTVQSDAETRVSQKILILMLLKPPNTEQQSSQKRTENQIQVTEKN